MNHNQETAFLRPRLRQPRTSFFKPWIQLIPYRSRTCHEQIQASKTF